MLPRSALRPSDARRVRLAMRPRPRAAHRSLGKVRNAVIPWKTTPTASALPSGHHDDAIRRSDRLAAVEGPKMVPNRRSAVEGDDLQVRHKPQAIRSLTCTPETATRAAGACRRRDLGGGQLVEDRSPHHAPRQREPIG